MIKMAGAVSVCDSPTGHRPDDLRNRPRLCGKTFFIKLFIAHYFSAMKHK